MEHGPTIDRPLAAERIAGSAELPIAVLAHGVTQNRHCWGEFAERLGERFAVWAVDLPGHGDSGHHTASFDAAAHLLADTIGAITERTETEVSLLVGYSMGGRFALRAMLDRRDLAARLVLIGATAGIDDADERAARRAADGALADRLRAEGAADFLDGWLALPLFADLRPEQQLRSARLEHWGAGVPETFEHRGTGSMTPMWDRLGGLGVPTLVLAGAADPKFVAIGERLVDGLGGVGALRLIAGSGHACQLAAPALTAEVVLAWASVDEPGARRAGDQ